MGRYGHGERMKNKYNILIPVSSTRPALDGSPDGPAYMCVPLPLEAVRSLRDQLTRMIDEAERAPDAHRSDIRVIDTDEWFTNDERGQP